jgi:site-specific DNA-cytosine methylase
MTDNSDKLCIDLCSGLGGFSRAFKDAGWEVVTVDVEERFLPTVVADVRNLGSRTLELATKKKSFRAYAKVIVLSSPPCTFFSRAAGLGIIREGTGRV